MSWGGKREGAGRKPIDDEERKIYTVRVSQAEREAIKDLLDRMRAGIPLETWCHISKEEAEKEYNFILRSYAYAMCEKDKDLAALMSAQAEVYAQILGKNYLDDEEEAVFEEYQRLYRNSDPLEVRIKAIEEYKIKHRKK